MASCLFTFSPRTVYFECIESFQFSFYVARALLKRRFLAINREKRIGISRTDFKVFRQCCRAIPSNKT